MVSRFLSRLRKDSRGVAAIELGLIAPVLAVMVVGVIDISNGINRKLHLEQAAQRSLEMVLQTTGDDTVEAAIVQQVVQQAEVPAESVTVTRRLECNRVQIADFTQECAANQIEARYIMVTINDRYTPMMPLHFAGIHSDGSYHIRAEAGMRTQ